MTYTARVIIFPPAKYLMRLILPNWTAITIGHVIIAAHELDEATLHHEQIHVDQWDRYGWRFPFLYLWSSYAMWRAGYSWYWDNKYEREARGGA